MEPAEPSPIARQRPGMRSEDIRRLLKKLEDRYFTDSGVLEMLQDIRNKVMSTKGGIQCLVKAGCVLCLIRLLNRHVHTEAAAGCRRTVGERGVNVVVSILANMFMDSEARSQIKRDGIETLATILSDSTNEDVQIRCSRALGNLAMDAQGVRTIAQAKVLPCLVKLLKIEYQEKPRGLVDMTVAASRCTQLPAPTDESLQQVAAEDTVLVAKFPSLALIQVVCRAIRYLSGDAKVRCQLVEEGMVGALASLLKADNSLIVTCCLRALSVFWLKMNKRVTERMACEVAQAGTIPHLMEHVKSIVDEISCQAFIILLALTEHPRTAALIGASGGVTLFLSLLAQLPSNIRHVDVVSGLCHLAKEAVNRAKIREQAGLRVFLETLRDDNSKVVHDQVISCLLSFLYDDASLTLMLADGLIDILLRHLQRCSGFVSQEPISLLREAELLLAKPGPGSCPTKGHSSALETVDSKSESLPHSVKEASSMYLKSLQSSLQSYEPSGEGMKDKPFVEGNDLHLQSRMDNASNAVLKQCIQTINQMEANIYAVSTDDNADKDDGGSSAAQRDNVYSMNSPTYKPEMTWSMEDYCRGITHKSFSAIDVCFSPEPDTMCQGIGSPYSPLSNDTYYSPTYTGQLSPPFSPCASSPDSHAAVSPAYSPGLSPCGNKDDGAQYAEWHRSGSAKTFCGESPTAVSSLGCGPSARSPSVRSPTPLSLGSPTSVASWESVIEFSSEDEDCPHVDDIRQDCCTPALKATEECGTGMVTCTEPEGEGISDSGSTVLADLKDTPVIASGHMPTSSIEEGEKCDESNSRWITSTFSVTRCLTLDYSGDTSDREGKGSRKLGEHARISETNILILLSRISVWEDPSGLLANPVLISCLVDYLTLTRQPQSRCERILSRILSSPQCLASLLTTCVPVTVVRGCFLRPTRGVLSPSHPDRRHAVCGSPTNFQPRAMRAFMKEKTIMSGTQSKLLALAPGTCEGRAYFPSQAKVSQGIGPTNVSTVSAEKQEGDLLASTYESQHQEQSCGPRTQGLRKAGLKFLSDLSYLALSPYGEGVIRHALLCRHPQRQLVVAISLLFLLPQWGVEKQRKFLCHLGALEKVLSALCHPQTTSRVIKDAVVMGLVFLLQHMNIPSRFEPHTPHHLLQRAIASLASEGDETSGVQISSRGIVLESSTAPAAADREVRCGAGEVRCGAGEESMCTSGSSGKASANSRNLSCVYASSGKDLHFMTGSCEKLEANRELLIRKSPIFAAMLTGSYLESQQSEIVIQNTSPGALCFVLHFLHGCTAECPVLSYFDRIVSSNEARLSEAGVSLQNFHDSQKGNNNGWLPPCNKQNALLLCCDAISLSDRFLILELVQYLDCVLSLQLLDAAATVDVFQFAVLHGMSGLAEDSLLALLMSPQPFADIAATVIDLAESETSHHLVKAVTALVRRGLAIHK